MPSRGPPPKLVPTDKTGEQSATYLYTAMEKASTSTEPADEVDISDVDMPIPDISVEDLPHCPKCKEGLLRPGVFWFGEMFPKEALSTMQDFTNKPEKIDLILIIGTSSKVYPAAGYVDIARSKGARVAVVNMDRADTPGGRNGLMKGDWFFEGDAGEIVPAISKSVVGEL